MSIPGKANPNFAEAKARLAQSDGTCDICARDYRGLVIDIDRPTGDVRGVICSKCRLGMRVLDEDPQLIRDAATYLQQGN